jgi:hypothetical protein
MRLKIKNFLVRVAASLGIFITSYQEDYVYVPVKKTRKGKLVDLPLQDTNIKSDKQPLGDLSTLDEDLFYKIANRVISDGKTFLSHDRLYILWQSIRNVRFVFLPAVEVGSYRGGSAFFIATALNELLGTEVPLHVIDTFEGHPDKVSQEFDNQHVQGYFSDTSFEDVQSYLSGFSKVIMHKGEFTSVAKELSVIQYGFVHIDVDIYQSILDCLNYFGERIVEGGVIVVDDYGAPSCPGVERAVKEYLQKHNNFYVWQPFTEQIILVKSINLHIR